MKKLDVQTVEEIAEYMALAQSLCKEDPPEKYVRANMLCLKLAMLLPADLYRSIMRAIASPSEQCNPLSVASLVRSRHLDGVDGSLSADEIGHHAPGIGQYRREHLV